MRTFSYRARRQAWLGMFFEDIQVELPGECLRGKVIELEVQACEGMLGTAKNNQSRSIAVTKCRAVRAHAWQQHDQQRERSSGRVEKTVRPGDTNQLMGFAPRL